MVSYVILVTKFDSNYKREGFPLPSGAEEKCVRVAHQAVERARAAEREKSGAGAGDGGSGEFAKDFLWSGSWKIEHKDLPANAHLLHSPEGLVPTVSSASSTVLGCFPPRS